MHWLHVALARVRSVLRPGDGDDEFDRELETHMAMAVDEKIRHGLTPAEARRAARLELGGLAQLREARREARGVSWLASSWLDVKLGVRLLRKYPGLTIVSTLALAIAIAIVAGFYAGTEFFVRPTLPVPEGGRVVAVWNRDLSLSARGDQTLGDMLTWRREIASLEDVGAFRTEERAVVAADGHTRLVRAAEISPSAFRMLRVAPYMGRPLLEDDERPGSPPVALIGFALWQAAFGADPAIVGESIRVGGVERTVVGVMPSGFAFPIQERLWMPLQIPASGLEPGAGPSIDLSIGRLSPGASIAAAEAELRVVGTRLAADYPQTHERLRPRIIAYARSYVGVEEPEMVSLMYAARVSIAIVLLVVCANVGTLVYARNSARLGEVVLRTALGASRFRIAVQMFLEALVLSALAAVVGVAILLWPLHLFAQAIATFVAGGEEFPYWFTTGFGSSTAFVVIVLVLVAAALTGVLPALKLTDSGLQLRLQRMHDGSSGLRFGRTATAVVVLQVALSMALMTIGASQLVAFAKDWTSRDDGVDRDQYVAASLRWDVLPSGADNRSVVLAGRADTRRELARQISSEPAVSGVTFEAVQGMRPFEAEPPSSSGETRPRWTSTVAIEPGYFDVYRSRIRSGRLFDAADQAESNVHVAIVNEEFVRTVLGSAQPIGQRIRPVDPRTGRPSGESLDIVGVVRNFLRLEVTRRGPGWVPSPTVYVPLLASTADARMVVRVRREPERLADRVRTIAAGIDPTLVLYQVGTLEDLDGPALTIVSLYGIGAGFLVFAVLLLSTAGVYSMMSFTVAQRRKEIGIRTALGADPRRVVRDVFARAFAQLGAGMVLGLAVGLLASAGLFARSAWPFGQGLAFLLGIAALILAMGVIACARPLRQALRIQPIEALRSDG